MEILGIIFDVNGTLIDINTDEGNEEIYRGISHFLTYQGITLHRWEVRDQYYQIMNEHKAASREEFPEFDAVGLWAEFLRRHQNPLRPLPPAKAKTLPLILAEMYRGISRNRLVLYPGVKDMLDELSAQHRLAAVSDAQSAWARAEMQALKLTDYFGSIVVSGDYGYRKPDPRLFRLALKKLRLPWDKTVFVGNDMYRDMYGAGRLGLATIFFSSNQGRKEMEGVNPDYIIYEFGQLKEALEFLRAHK
ncbi:MAG: HAD family hydrolase [Deltaproteobacteria bacterium]|nr:HAD family hydrolase [Deltaproteobacteria bacterium]